MTRKLKTLGLALVAVFAMSAMTASVASATDFVTVSGGGTAWATGVSHDNVFKITSPKINVTCTTASFTATLTNGSSSIAALASYVGKVPSETPHGTKCNGTVESTIDMNDCEYKLAGNTSGSDGGTDDKVWIVCPVGKKIIITGPGCEITIPEQTPTEGGVTYKTEPTHPGGSAIKLTATVTAITWESHGSLCPLVGLGNPGHGQNADYNGTVIVTGWGDNGGTLTAPTETGTRKSISTS